MDHRLLLVRCCCRRWRGGPRCPIRPFSRWAAWAGVPARPPSWTLEPDLALALFVHRAARRRVSTPRCATSRQLAAVSTLVFIAVGLTTANGRVLAHWLVPGMPWAAAIALGAIVAPRCGGCYAILRQVKLPYRLLKILEGESLLTTPARC